jgi:hypothetical protein
MTQIKELFVKAKAWVEKTYDFNSPMNKYDYILVGTVVGALLIMIKSFIPTLIVSAILVHLANVRKG